MPHSSAPHPLLPAHPVTHTTRIDEAEESVSRWLTGHRLTNISGPLSLTHNALHVGELSLHYIDYGGGLTVHPEPNDAPFYLVQVPLAGHMRLWAPGTGALECGPGGAIASLVGAADSTMQYSEGCARLLVKLPVSVLRKRRSAMWRDVGGYPTSAMLDVSRGPGRSWLQLLYWLIDDSNGEGGMVAREAGTEYATSLIADGLLLAQLNDHEAQSSATSKTVRLAVDFIRANHVDPITITEVAAAAHASVRSLQQGFKRDLSMTPMQYLRDVRLDAVHGALQAATPSSSVSDIAHDAGIHHLGRFARDYRQRFDVTPSHTLRQPSGGR